MEPLPHYRRLPGYGWAIEDEHARLEAVKRDGTRGVDYVGPIVGTQEAARALGIRPSNFVRDRAARPDFPTPLATLSSGRIWSAAAIKRHAARRGRPAPTDARLLEIARRTVWWQGPERTLTARLDFIGRVLATGTVDEIRDVERRYGLATLRRAVRSAAGGIFDRRSWNFWLLALDMEPRLPLPARTIA